MAEAGWIVPELRTGVQADAALIERRTAMRALDAIQIIDPGAVVSAQTIAGVPCVVAEAPDAWATLVYTHGGGFRLGEPETWTGFASRLAMAAGLRVVVPGYRLAPEHPFPAALHDLVAVYRALEGPKLVGGDSAGGGLACSLALVAGEAGVPAEGVMLLSPWLDLTVEAASYTDCAASDPAFSAEAAREAAAQYLAGADAGAPLASPLRQSSLAGFPPVWVAVGGGEVLRDDTLDFARRLACEGGTVTLSVEPALPHVWPILMPGHEATASAIAGMAAFAARVLKA